MYDTADVWTHGVDGSVGAESRRVDSQGGGTLFNHIPDDVDLHLEKKGQQKTSADASALELELMDALQTCDGFLKT